MKRKIWISVVFAFWLALILPVAGFAGGLRNGQVVFGEDFTLRSGEVINGDLVLIGAHGTLKEGAVVTHNVAIIGGQLDSAGEIGGDVVDIGGELHFRSTSVVKGEVVLFGANLKKEDGAQVGEVYHFESARPFSAVVMPTLSEQRLEWMTKGMVRWFGFLFRVFTWAALAVLAGLLFPQSLETIRQTIVNQPLISGGMGFLTFVITAIGIILLTVTLIFIPIAFIGLVVGLLAWLYGIVGLGLETGHRLAAMLGQDWSTPIKAGAGTFLFVFVVDGIAALIPCIGWTIPLLFGMIGFGAIVTTRFGTRPGI
ncbi:MAG: hypothetical protein ACOY16_13605 [Chloroflexota bacterium]